MLNPNNGILTFETPPATLEPWLTRDGFLNGSFAVIAKTHVENEPYHSWKLSSQFRSANINFWVAIFFHDQQLTMLSLMDDDPRFGTSWDDYSLEKEMERKASHDTWLTHCLASKRKFSWGSVWSGYDDRGGFSSIKIRYGGAR